MARARVPASAAYPEPAPGTRTPGGRDEFERIRRAALLGEEDVAALRRVGRIVGAHDFLLAYFSGRSGPDARYLSSRCARFGHWVLDTCEARFDEAWLAYQYGIGRRHCDRKDRADGVADAPPLVRFRHMVPLVHPIYATVRPFLERGERDPAEVERRHQTWLTAALLSVTLWSQPYPKEGAF